MLKVQSVNAHHIAQEFEGIYNEKVLSVVIVAS